MNRIRRTLSRALTGATALAVTASGAVLIGAATAPAANAAKLRDTEYGLQTAAYGTRVVGGTLGVGSGRTAWTWISCTSLSGLERERSGVDVSIPSAENPMIQLSGMKSTSRTFQNKRKGIAAAAESTHTIGDVTIGDAVDIPLLQLRALESTSRAWADTDGELHARSRISSGQLRLIIPEGTPIPPEMQGPLDDLLAAVDEGIKQVFTAITDNGGEIEIPGLGKIMAGKARKGGDAYHARARGAILKVQLYGEDAEAGTGDDMIVNLGRSWARINRDIPVGLFHGKSFGASLEVLDGLLSVGELGLQPMPCRGTDGEVVRTPLLDLDLGKLGQISLSGAEGASMALPRDNGSAVAWTRGRLSSLTLGPVQLNGITAKAKVKQNRKGDVVRRTIRGSGIGEVVVDGESQGSFDPETASQIPLDQLPPEVASVEFFKTKKGKRSMQVTAVVVTLAEETEGVSKIRLGHAQVKIARY